MSDSILNLILRASKTGSGVAEARTELGGLDQDLKKMQKSASQSTAGYFAMAQSLQKNSDISNITRQSLSGLKSEMLAGRVTTAQYADASQAALLQAKMISPASLQAATSIRQLNQGYADGKINSEQYATGLRTIQRELDASTSFTERYGAAIDKIALGSLVALGAGFAMVVKSAGEYEAAMNQIVALTDTTSAEIGGMSQAVLAMAQQTGKAPKELADALYFVASSGFAGAKGLDVLEASAKASAAGLGQTKVVADAVTSALNAYKEPAERAVHYTDLLIQIVKEGKGEPTAFAQSLGRILPIASAVGVSFEQVGASMATMTRIGLSAEESATALRGVLGALEAPGKAAKGALDKIGFSADGLRKSIAENGLLATLQELMLRTHGNVEELDAIIPNIRALTGVLATAGSQAEAYSTILDSMNNASGATETAFKTASETMDFKAKQVSASFDVLKVTIANGLLPTIKTLLDAANNLIGGFLKLPPASQQFIEAVGLIALGAAPAIAGITRVIGVVKTLGEQFSKFKDMRAAGDGLFKSLSALRGLEFGALAIGLTVIIGYLEKVTEAASASYDELEKMAHSGGFFEQAAASTEILLNGQARLSAAFVATEQKILASAESYDEYRSAVIATARASGDLSAEITGSRAKMFLADAEAGKLAEGYVVLDGKVYQTTNSFHLMTQASFEARNGSADLAAEIENGTAQHQGYQRATTQVTEAVTQEALAMEDTRVKAEALKLEEERLTNAGAALTAGYGGAVAKEIKSYGDKQADLTSKAADLRKQIEALSAAQGLAVTVGKKGALTSDELTAAQSRQAMVLEDLTNRTRKKKETDAEFQSRMDGLQVTYDNLTGKIQAAGGATQGYIDNSKKIGDLTKQYDDVTKSINDLSAAHQETMARMVLDIAMQQMAQGGWTQNEIDAFTRVAVKMGVFDQASADLTKNVLGATAQLAADGNIDTFDKSLTGALDDINNSSAVAAADMATKMGGMATAAAEHSSAAATYLGLISGGLNSVGASASTMAGDTSMMVQRYSASLDSARVNTDVNAKAMAASIWLANNKIRTDAEMAAAGLSQSVPPALSAIATDPNPGIFAGSFGQNMSSVSSAAGGAAQATNTLKAAIDLLQSKTITIKTNFVTSGSPPSTGSNTTSTTPSTPPSRQYGGPVDRPTLVGEAGPELFFPRSGGFVMDNADSMRLIKTMEMIANILGGTRGGNTYQLNVAPDATRRKSITQDFAMLQALAGG